MIKLPCKDRNTIPWMAPREIPAIKAVLSAWRKMRRNNPAECDSIRKYIAECSTPWNVVDIEADHAAYYLEKLTAIDERMRNEAKKETDSIKKRASVSTSDGSRDAVSATPWRLDGRTIRDVEGDVVVSTFSPANMETRRLIVEAVNGVDATRELQRKLLGWSIERDRLRNELDRLTAAFVALQCSRDAALAENTRLRNIVRRLEDEYEQLEERDTVCNTDRRPGVPPLPARGHTRDEGRTMKILHRSHCAILPLVLKGKWFRMIESGEKREEYRACTPYWAIRLSNWDNTDATAHVVEFRLGYAKDAPRVAYDSPWYTSTDDCRHPEWGEPDGLHYIIFLGQPVILKGEP